MHALLRTHTCSETTEAPENTALACNARHEEEWAGPTGMLTGIGGRAPRTKGQSVR